MLPPMKMRLLLCLALALAGCSTSTVAKRKQERLNEYQALPAEQQQLVDKGEIRIGMPETAVYIAWGKPSQILREESAEGLLTTWLYQSQTLEESHLATFREVRHNGQVVLTREIYRDFVPRDYVSAEITIKDGKVLRWRTLPRPAN